MDRYSKQTPRASHRRRVLFTFYPSSIRTIPSASASQVVLLTALMPPTQCAGCSRAYHVAWSCISNPSKWLTADRELGLHPHPALKVLS
jgi:hypothetical protein